jgi:membrane associated rhomboid family serine protease
MSDPEEDAPTCYRHPDRQTFISCQRCGRHICPACQTQAAVGVHCPECVREGRAAAAPGAVVARALRPRGRAVVTYSLMGLIAVGFAVQWLSGQSLTNAWVLNPTVVGAEPWRLLTSAFLHSPAVVIHILFNLYALYAFGPALEAFLGRVRFLALYLISALGGSLGVLAIYQLWIATDGRIVELTGGFISPSSALGASGAIFGLIGAYLPLRRAIGVNFTQLLILLGINLAIGFFAGGIAWEAHLGGLLVGALIGWVFARTRRPAQQRTQRLWIVGIAVALLVVFVLFVASSPGDYGL